jgi:hypothetical protein
VGQPKKAKVKKIEQDPVLAGKKRQRVSDIPVKTRSMSDLLAQGFTMGNLQGTAPSAMMPSINTSAGGSDVSTGAVNITIDSSSKRRKKTKSKSKKKKSKKSKKSKNNKKVKKPLKKKQKLSK